MKKTDNNRQPLQYKVITLICEGCVNQDYTK